MEMPVACQLGPGRFRFLGFGGLQVSLQFGDALRIDPFRRQFGDHGFSAMRARFRSVSRVRSRGGTFRARPVSP